SPPLNPPAVHSEPRPRAATIAAWIHLAIVMLALLAGVLLWIYYFQDRAIYDQAVREMSADPTWAGKAMPTREDTYDSIALLFVTVLVVGVAAWFGSTWWLTRKGRNAARIVTVVGAALIITATLITAIPAVLTTMVDNSSAGYTVPPPDPFY